jgi:hypothetical protein
VAIFGNFNLVSFLKIAARIRQTPKNFSGNSPGFLQFPQGLANCNLGCFLKIAARIYQTPKNFSGNFPGFLQFPQGSANSKTKSFSRKKTRKVCTKKILQFNNAASSNFSQSDSEPKDIFSPKGVSVFGAVVSCRLNRAFFSGFSGLGLGVSFSDTIFGLARFLDKV